MAQKYDIVLICDANKLCIRKKLRCSTETTVLLEHRSLTLPVAIRSRICNVVADNIVSVTNHYDTFTVNRI